MLRVLLHVPLVETRPLEELLGELLVDYSNNQPVNSRCSCNTTHHVTFDTTRGANASSDVHQNTVHVYFLHSGIQFPSIPPVGTHLLWTIEPPPHLRAHIVHGFSGVVGYRRTDAMWLPLIDHSRVHELIGGLRTVQLQGRDSIGIWVANCNHPVRNDVIDALLRTNLNVRSYGPCRKTRNVKGSMRLDGDGLVECRRHRFMLAIENEACDDFVGRNLLLALECGAIPIVHSVRRVPDYRGLFGPLPMIDVNRQGWLGKLHRLMTDGVRYREWVTGRLQRYQEWHARREAKQASRVPTTRRCCDWFGAAQLRARPMSLGQCYFCRNVSDPAGYGQERQRAFADWSDLVTPSLVDCVDQRAESDFLRRG